MIGLHLALWAERTNDLDNLDKWPMLEWVGTGATDDLTLSEDNFISDYFYLFFRIKS
jgi:hypothetical protein